MANSPEGVEPNFLDTVAEGVSIAAHPIEAAKAKFQESTVGKVAHVIAHPIEAAEEGLDELTARAAGLLPDPVGEFCEGALRKHFANKG